MNLNYYYAFLLTWNFWKWIIIPLGIVLLLFIIFLCILSWAFDKFDEGYIKPEWQPIEPGTETTLNRLRLGDCFSFTGLFGEKRTDPWRVTSAAFMDKVGINQIATDRTPIYRKDQLKSGTRKVIFIRHTKPLPGEECILDDLDEGDQFKIPAQDFHTWVFEKRGNFFHDVRRIDEAACVKGGMQANVIFLKHKK